MAGDIFLLFPSLGGFTSVDARVFARGRETFRNAWKTIEHPWKNQISGTTPLKASEFDARNSYPRTHIYAHLGAEAFAITNKTGQRMFCERSANSQAHPCKPFYA